MIALSAAAGCNSDDSSGEVSRTEVIGPEGGAVTLGDASVDIPEGALSEETEVGIARVSADIPPPAGYDRPRQVFAFTPHGTTFNTPVTITLPYNAAPNGLVVLRLADEQDTTWEIIETATFGGGLATLDVSSFCLMGVGSPTAAGDSEADVGPDVSDDVSVDPSADPAVDPSVDPSADPAVDPSVDAGDLQEVTDSEPDTQEQVLPFAFYASYERLIDQENHGVNLYNCDVDMSNDGSVMVGYAYDEDAYYAFTIDAAGANFRSHVLENISTYGPDAVAMSPDGTRGYVASHTRDGGDDFPVLFRLEGETMTRVEVRPAIEAGVGIVGHIRTNSDGSLIFMRDGGHHHVFTVDHDGLNFGELIDPSDFIETDESRGLWISEIDVSDSGNHVAFIMERWVPPPGGGSYDLQDDIMTWQASTQFARITRDDDPEIGKQNVVISPDGTRLLYLAHGNDTAYTADFGGALIEPIPNLSGRGSAAASSDMGIIFWANTSFSYSGGVTISRDGTNRRELFAGTSIDADGALNMNTDGTRIAFVHTYKSSPSVRTLYYGWLGTEDDPTDAPNIDWIRISAPLMPRDDPEAELVVTVQVSDDDGLGVIDEVNRDELHGGTAFESSSAPVSLAQPVDDGSGPDAVAGDGIYSALCTPTSAMGDYPDSDVTLRIGVEDVDGNAVVADVTLPIGP